MTKLIPLTAHDTQYTDNPNLLEHFNTWVADGHEMTILREDDLYRHLRFKKVDRSEYWFDLITWPGYLTITGDMGCYTFARNPDMFAFFNQNQINSSYWAEKCQNGARWELKEHSSDDFKKWLMDDFWTYSRSMDFAETTAWWKNIKEQLRDIWLATGTQEECGEVLDELSLLKGTPEDHYNDWYEHDWNVYPLQFELCLAAILSGVRTYHRHHAELAAANAELATA